MQPKRCVIHIQSFQFVTRPPSQDWGLFLSLVCSSPQVCSSPAERPKDNILLSIIKTIQKNYYFFLFFT